MLQPSACDVIADVRDHAVPLVPSEGADWSSRAARGPVPVEVEVEVELVARGTCRSCP